MPRDEAYYGDPETNSTHSRHEYRRLAWIPELLGLRTRVEGVTPAAAYANLSLQKLSYNAVLCNLYRNGNDSVGFALGRRTRNGTSDRFRQFRSGNAISAKDSQTPNP